MSVPNYCPNSLTARVKAAINQCSFIIKKNDTFYKVFVRDLKGIMLNKNNNCKLCDKLGKPDCSAQSFDSIGTQDLIRHLNFHYQVMSYSIVTRILKGNCIFKHQFSFFKIKKFKFLP